MSTWERLFSVEKLVVSPKLNQLEPSPLVFTNKKLRIYWYDLACP